jgi:CHAD domain-containing protein
MAKVATNDTMGVLAQGAIAKYLKQAISYEERVLADTDPEDLHQMRVGLRRLRTALQVFDVAVTLPKAGREPQVASIARRLGELRDLDVISETLRKRYAPDLPDPEHLMLEEVLSYLHEQRQAVLKRVKKLLKGKKYKQMKQALKDWTAEPTYQDMAQMPAAMVVPDLVGPLVSRLWLHPGFLVGAKFNSKSIKANTRLSVAATDQLISEQGPLLHSLRKQVKRVRYQLKLVSNLYGDTLENDIQRLSDMQETLGNLQDSTVLEKFISAAVPDAKAQMPTLFALLADSRHHAWKQWQTHQTYYLAPTHRQQLRLTLIQPASSEPETKAEASEGKKTKAQGHAKAKSTGNSAKTTRGKSASNKNT